MSPTVKTNPNGRKRGRPKKAPVIRPPPPPPTIIRDVRPSDILHGRGFPFHSHPGNNVMKTIIADNKHRYLTAERNEKRGIIQSVIQQIQNNQPTPRFLTRICVEGKPEWCLSTEEEAYKKISHALRERRQKDRLCQSPPQAVARTDTKIVSPRKKKGTKSPGIKSSTRTVSPTMDDARADVQKDLDKASPSDGISLPGATNVQDDDTYPSVHSMKEVFQEEEELQQQSHQINSRCIDDLELQDDFFDRAISLAPEEEEEVSPAATKVVPGMTSHDSSLSFSTEPLVDMPWIPRVSINASSGTMYVADKEEDHVHDDKSCDDISVIEANLGLLYDTMRDCVMPVQDISIAW